MLTGGPARSAARTGAQPGPGAGPWRGGAEDATAYLDPGARAALAADGQQPPTAWVFYH